MIVYLVAFDFNEYVFYALVATSLILGIQLVIPIGGADMPVVISLLELLLRRGGGRGGVRAGQASRSSSAAQLVALRALSSRTS